MTTCDANLVEAWRTILNAFGGADVEEDDDLLLASTEQPLAFFNPVFLKRPFTAEEASGVLDRVRHFYAQRHIPFLMWVRKDTQAPLLAAAEAVGLAANDGPPAMVMDPVGEAAPTPPELEIVMVDSPGLLGPTADVVAAAFGLPVDICHRVMSPRLIELPEVAVFTGLIAGHPVSTATLVLTDAVAGVYNVGTADPNRGRGYGAALTWAAVGEGARRGGKIAALQSSPLGRPVYEHMGFRHLGDYVHLVG